MWQKIAKIGVPVVIILLLVGMNLLQRKDHKEQTKDLLERIDILTRLISTRDSSLVHYSKMVDNFDISERDLKKQLKDINKEFADRLKEEEERILSIHEYNIVLQSKIDSFAIVDAEIEDGTLFFEIDDYYPQEKDYFVHYAGTVQIALGEEIVRPIIAREFSFSDINLNMVMTETAKGAWKYNILDAPDWINVGKIDIKSLPPEKYVEKPHVEFLVGGGVYKQYNGRAFLNLSAGAEYKTFQLIGSGGLGGFQVQILKRLTKN